MSRRFPDVGRLERFAIISGVPSSIRQRLFDKTEITLSLRLSAVLVQPVLGGEFTDLELAHKHPSQPVLKSILED